MHLRAIVARTLGRLRSSGGQPRRARPRRSGPAELLRMSTASQLLLHSQVEGSSWRLSQAMSIATVAYRRRSAPMLPGSRVSTAMDNAKNHDFVFQHQEEQAVRESSNECASNLAMDARVSRWEF